MTALVLGGMWGGLAAWLISTWASPVRRPAVPAGPAGPDVVPSSRRGDAGAAGTDVRSRERRRLVAVGVAVVVAVWLHPALVVFPVAGAVVLPRLDVRRSRRQRDLAVLDQLPDVVDLLRLTTYAGLPVGSAVESIGARPGGPLGAALASSGALLARGASTADALAALLDATGPAARPLVDALADHDHYGTPLGPVLDRVAVDSRLRRRRAAEEAARRLPVILLFPLVLTTLPAFVLLTLVPMLVGSFSSLGLG
jgi:tight adherence protein C